MGVRDFRDLVCWQLCHELKSEVWSFTATGDASRDFKFRDQIRGSSASAQANIAEGFGRYRPAEFARFLEFACSSLRETQNHLIDARDRNYLDERLYSRLMNLSRAALRTTANLLRSKQNQARAEARRSRSPRVAPNAIGNDPGVGR